MEIDKIIEELVETKILDIEKISGIRVGGLKTLINNKYDFNFELIEISEALKRRVDLIEISSNFFVLKINLEKILKDFSRDNYKKILQEFYMIEIQDNYLINIEIDSKARTYEEIKNYGLENSYIKAEWLETMNLDDSDIYEINEAYQELVKLGIEIK